VVDLAGALDRCLVDGRGFEQLTASHPRDEADALRTVLAIHDLSVAPVDALDGRERWQHHPAVAELRWRLEHDLVASLDRRDQASGWRLPADAPAAMRAVARVDQVPDVYRWLATTASPQELVEFLALEGGPDGGFDDLVAACQIGLGGGPKLELARNYWDEMGQGSPARVHTELHRKLARALDLPALPREEQPVEALERAALGSLLATNRSLQPELVGALGLLELQAGPRCRKVVEGLRRIGAGDDALDFYVEHATVDPHHGKAWIDEVVAPLSSSPRWAAGMVRGARWRSLVNGAFFAAMARRFVPAGTQRAS
jgi:Iron-containing redox enzyme